MILADSNAIIALIVDDRPTQSASVLEAVSRALTSGEEIVLCEAVLVEVCRVLRRTYGLRRETIAVVMTDLIQVAPLRAWDEPLALAALDLMRRKPALAITDCLLAVLAARDEAWVLTFDRVLQNELGATSA